MSDALRLPGVVDVITANDIPGKKARFMFGYEQELFAEDKVSTHSRRTSKLDLNGPSINPWIHL